MRLDLALVQRGLLPSRERAKAAVLAGEVLVNRRQQRKPSCDVRDGDALALLETHSYVGRGYLKLQKALDAFAIDLEGKACLDAGASTGGFTQCMLEHGARVVYAVDVGKGQLAACLREHERVVNLERTDLRSVTQAQIGQVGFASADVSFISLQLILPNLFALLEDTAQAVCLLKPQFETGAPVKHGVVKSPQTHVHVLEALCAAARREGFACLGLTHSPVAGGQGNIEFLLHLAKGGIIEEKPLQVQAVVREAWDALGGWKGSGA